MTRAVLVAALALAAPAAAQAPSGLYGKVITNLRKVTAKTVDEEPKWRVKGNALLSGYQPEKKR